MITITTGEWVADLRAMTCRNCATDIIVTFETHGKAVMGKIKDMPMELLEQWAEQVNGHLLLQKTVHEAEDAFFRAYFENEMRKNIKSSPRINT